MRLILPPSAERRNSGILRVAAVPSEEIMRHLPERLRTEHWYADIHHALFLILFADLFQAVDNNKAKLVEYYIDTITMYWLIHCLMEEEGMATALAAGEGCQDTVARHCRAHISIVKTWNREVFSPFKDRTLSGLPLRDGVQEVYGIIVRHIAEIDQDTYGAHSEKTSQTLVGEIAHLAGCGLPLSPLMAGTGEAVRRLAPMMSKRLSPDSLGTATREPLKTLTLTAYPHALWSGGKGAFRDRFLASQVGLGRNRQVA